MKNLENWMVGMDFSSTDKPLIAYTSFLAQHLKPKKIYFVHIQEAFGVPEEVKRNLSDTTLPTRESLRVKMEAQVRPHFKNQEQFSCEVYVGHPSFELWREAHLHNIDLFLGGSKSGKADRGMLPKKMIRKSPCSVLFVPENAKLPIHKILVPTDFSKNAARAMNTTLEVARRLQNCSLVGLHVYELPNYYYPAFPRQQHIEAMEKAARKEYENFIQPLDTHAIEINPVFALREYNYVAEHIKNEAEAQKVDLIIMSAGGKSKLSTLFLGSEAERIVQMEKKIPVMILKEKEKNIGLWDILTKL